MPSFKSPDGKEFTSKTEYRDYMMLTYYSLKNIKQQTLTKNAGDIDGQGFDIADCEDSTLIVMDLCEQVQIDEVKNCRIFIGACASSIFIRNCSNCTFYTACRQLRLRDVKDCHFYIYSMSEVHIEFSSNVAFAPFNGGYPEQSKHFEAAKLDAKLNLWYDIFDHNDPLKTRSNWSLIPEDKYEEAWFPAGICTPAVPRTTSGSAQHASPSADSSMQSFGFDQLVVDSKQAKPAPPTGHTTAASMGSAIGAAVMTALGLDSTSPKVPSPPALPNAAPVEQTTDEKAVHLVIQTFAMFQSGLNTAVREKLIPYEL